jgi:hypothetical protein
MTNRTKIAHNGTIYEVTETITAADADKDYPAYAALIRNNGIIATHGVRRPNGRKVWMLDEYANGTTGNLISIG